MSHNPFRLSIVRSCIRCTNLTNQTGETMANGMEEPAQQVYCYQQKFGKSVDLAIIIELQIMIMESSLPIKQDTCGQVALLRIASRSTFSLQHLFVLAKFGVSYKIGSLTGTCCEPIAKGIAEGREAIIIALAAQRMPETVQCGVFNCTRYSSIADVFQHLTPSEGCFFTKI